MLSSIEQFEGMVECTKCGYKWMPRKPRPKACPECKSRKWEADRERTT